MSDDNPAPPPGFPPQEPPPQPPPGSYPPQGQPPVPGSPAGYSYYSQQAPGHWQTPVTPPVKKSSKKMIWIIVGIVGGVFVIGGIAVAFAIFTFVGAVTAPVDTANEYLAAVREGDTTTIIALSCDSRTNPDDAIDAFGGPGELRSYFLSTSNIVNSQAEVAGVATLTDGADGTITMTLMHESGRSGNGWRVCGFDTSFAQDIAPFDIPGRDPFGTR